MDKTETTALVMVSIMIVTDYLTGLIKAAMQHDISSEKMRNGLYHKVSFVIVMFLAEIIERAQQSIDLGFSMPIVAPAAIYITITEVSSVLENLGEINPELKNSRLLTLFRSNRTGEEE